MKNRPGQKGFTVVEGLILVLVVVMITVGSWWVGQKNRTKVISAVANNNSSDDQNRQVDDTKFPDPSAVFTSVAGNFSFTYPRGWKIVDKPPTSDDPDEYIYMTPPLYETNNNLDNFSAILYVNDRPNNFARVPNYGVTQKLPNGIYLWTPEKGHVPSREDGTNCTPLYIVNPDGTHFYHDLPNGRNISLSASYCNGESQKTTLSYFEQVNGIDWRALVGIIRSINFK